ncbi:hypothetical protein D9M70_548110 [compost metagenome]
MRQITWLIALGITVFGLSASAAVKPSISRPPKLNMMKAMAITSPPTPLGKKPPCAHRLLTAACSPPLPLNSSQQPSRIMPTMATTLIMANQNSVSPNSLTLARLMTLTATKNSAALAQVGTSGHQ